MRLARFELEGRCGYGYCEDGSVYPIAWEPFERTLFEPEPIELSRVRMLSPVSPTKIIAVGLNYTDHAEELGMEPPAEPVIFLKAPSTVLGHRGEVSCPEQSKRVDYEGELAVVIGGRCRSVTEKEAPGRILGYTCGMDITARDLQIRDGQWTRAKNFDTFCPLGPWVETEADPGDLSIELRLNGETRQASRTSKMVFGVSYLVSFVSSVMTLEPGDVILTGTPAGVGEIHEGDELECCIEGIGNLSCSVSAPGRGTSAD